MGKFQELIGDRAPQFVASVIQATNDNHALAKADPLSVVNAAAMAAILDMPINNNIGEAYIIPYNQRQPDNTWKTVAQFQIGYKGLIKLAMNTGQYLKLSAAKIYKSQFKSFDPLRDELILDTTVPPSGEVIGFAAYLKLKSGFEKFVFMTTAELQDHGKKYSKSFDKDSSQWKKNYDAMAEKTVLKRLISKWGLKSVQLSQALNADQAVVQDMDGSQFAYPDNAADTVNQASDINADFTPHEDVPANDDLI